ncbi:MAG TPA: XRE family transcriptional regulator [Lachnospiraceae bacterium]|nr:XRE family transcriptional regulator [Lachnospiraceae bacterium]
MTLKEKLQNIAVEKSDIFDDLTSAEKETDRLLSQISAMIYRKRKKMHITQKAFAQKNDVTQPMVSEWESGECDFTISKIAEIFTSLNMKIELNIIDDDTDIISPDSGYKSVSDKEYTSCDFQMLQSVA